MHWNRYVAVPRKGAVKVADMHLDTDQLGGRPQVSNQLPVTTRAASLSSTLRLCVGSHEGILAFLVGTKSMGQEPQASSFPSVLNSSRCSPHCSTSGLQPHLHLT